jgi:hypothetical protein
MVEKHFNNKIALVQSRGRSLVCDKCLRRILSYFANYLVRPSARRILFKQISSGLRATIDRDRWRDIIMKVKSCDHDPQ